LELLYSKNEILLLYSSHAPFGGNVVGLPAAAWRYYGRSSNQLSWGEAAALAVLPNSPSLIFPGKNEKIFKAKRNFLLKKLLSKGVIDSLTYYLSREERLPGRPHDLPRLAPRLITRMINDGLKGRRNVVTIDPNLQQMVSRITMRHMEKLNANFVFNAAVLVIEISTGEAKAYVGNVDSEEIHGQSVDIITAQRSTGSLLKPFLFAAAIDEGLITPDQLLGDYPIFYKGFSPKNFDLKYRGAVHAQEALTRSLNLPFVLLLKEYGYEKIHQKLKRIGMNSLNRSSDHYGLSIILGGAESNLWELTNMYANLYRVYRNSFDQSIMNRYDGVNYFENQYLANQPKMELVTGFRKDELSIASIWSTLKAMEGLHRPVGSTGWESFRSSTPISWKTGTSFGFRDAWAIGLNGKYVVGVWVGNADGEGRPGLVGGQVAAPIMFEVFQQLKSEPFDKVPTSETMSYKICQKSGQKANPYCVQVIEQTLPESISETPHCSYHQLIHLDQTQKYQVNSTCYNVDRMIHKSWFVLPPVQAWYYRQINANYKNIPPFSEGCQHTGSHTSMELIYPRGSTKIYIPKELDGSQGLSIFEVAHSNSKEVVYWHLDGNYLGQTRREHQMGITADQGNHKLHLLDGQGQELELSFEVISEY